MKKLIILIVCIVTMFSFTSCGDITYEDAIKVVSEDVKTNGDNIGNGQIMILRDYEDYNGVKSTCQLGVSTTKTGSIIITMFKDYKDSYGSYSYGMDSEMLFVEFKPNNEKTHTYNFILSIDGAISGNETVEGSFDAANYKVGTSLKSSKFSDPEDLDNKKVVGRKGLDENASSYLDGLLVEFQKYLDELGEGLTLSNFGFTSFDIKDAE